MVDACDIIGGFTAGFILADLLTIPYSASALYLSIRGRYYWKIPYAVPIKSLTKERVIKISSMAIPYPKLQSINPLRVTVEYHNIKSRQIRLSPSGLGSKYNSNMGTRILRRLSLK
jgi:hypothetical protein